VVEELSNFFYSSGVEGNPVSILFAEDERNLSVKKKALVKRNLTKHFQDQFKTQICKLFWLFEAVWRMVSP